MILEKMHEMYTNDFVTKEITGALDRLIGKLTADLDEIEAERLLNFAVTYLGIMEKELGVSDVSGEISERRDGVKVALFTRGAVNLSGAIQLGVYMLGYADGEYSALDFLYIPVLEKYADEEKVKSYLAALREYLPAHILIGDAVNYIRIWEEVKSVTWGTVANNTWDEVIYKADLS